MKKIFTIIVLVSIIGVNGFSQIPTNGLVGYWPFNGNAHDSSGNGNNGVVNGATPCLDRFGNANSAYSFDGVNDWIEIPAPNTINFNQGVSYTISCWVKISPKIAESIYVCNGPGLTTFTRGTILSKYGCPYGPGKDEIQIGFDYDSIVFHDRGSNDDLETIYIDNAVTNNFLNIIAVRNSIVDSMFLYLDNILVGSGPCSHDNITDSIPVIIGKVLACDGCLNPSWDHFSGIIDDIRIYNRLLNQTEINSLYNEGICFQSITVTDTLIINASITGFHPVTYLNTIKIYPNPTSDHLTIDYGNYSSMINYTLMITNSLGQTVFTSPVNQSQSYIDLSSWSGNGLYFVFLKDANNSIVDIKKIILQ